MSMNEWVSKHYKPSGTCKCNWWLLKNKFSGAIWFTKRLANVYAIFALSFITEPSWPVITLTPPPVSLMAVGIAAVSIKIGEPPVLIILKLIYNNKSNKNVYCWWQR